MHSAFNQRIGNKEDEQGNVKEYFNIIRGNQHHSTKTKRQE